VRFGTVIPSTYSPPAQPPPPPDPAPVVEAKRKQPAMQVQSLLFSRADGWTAEKAKS